VAIKVKVRLMGVFRGLTGKEKFNLKLEKSSSVREIVERLVEPFPTELRRLLVDLDLVDPRPNALIFVNGREISVLDGLETEVGDGDEVVFIPVSHGG